MINFVICFLMQCRVVYGVFPMLETLHSLRRLGVRISMDDFGTGYSSISYLRRFPFDKIKIDRSFIRDVEKGGDALSIVRAITGLGASLGMTTTAEGVETIEQLSRLRSEGCDEVQGFYYSPAVRLEAVQALLDGIGAVPQPGSGGLGRARAAKPRDARNKGPKTGPTLPHSAPNRVVM